MMCFVVILMIVEIHWKLEIQMLRSFEGKSFVNDANSLLNFQPKIQHRKIPNISPGLIELRKHFLEGLFLEGELIFGGLIRMAFCVSIWESSLKFIVS